MRNHLIVSILSVFLATWASAGEGNAAPIVDQFVCSMQVSAFDHNPGYTAKMNLTGVRRVWDENGQRFESPGDDVSADITTPDGLEVQLQYQYTFKKSLNGQGWGLYSCLSGYTKYEGKTTQWACPDHWVPVSEKNGVPQFGDLKDVQQDILIDAAVPDSQPIGSMECTLVKTTD